MNLLHFKLFRSLFQVFFNKEYIIVMKMSKNFTHFCHLTPNVVSTWLLKDPIFIASVFSTFNFKPDTFSKSSNKLKRAFTEFKWEKTAVVSSANCCSLVSVPLISIPLMFYTALTAMAKISIAIKKRYGESWSPCCTPLSIIK